MKLLIPRLELPANPTLSSAHYMTDISRYTPLSSPLQILQEVCWFAFRPEDGGLGWPRSELARELYGTSARPSGGARMGGTDLRHR